MNGKTLWIGIGVLVAVVAVAGYFVFYSGKTTSPTYNAPSYQATTSPSVGNTATPGVGGQVKQITVSGNEYSFSPSSLSLSKGGQVTLTFKNTGKLSHNLVIDGLGVATRTIGSGESDTITFTVDKTGSFSFYCSVDAHRSLGMEGKLKAQ